MNEIKQLILVRHGETEWNITGRRNSFTDISMNEKGVRDVAKLAGYIKSAYPDASIWSSPAKRAQESASIISADLDRSFQTLPDATEINFGRFEGKTMEELAVEPEAALYHAWEKGARIQGVESLDEAASRAKRVFDEIMNNDPSNRSILVSHGAFIRVLICVMAINVPPTAYPNLITDNASVSVLRITKQRIRLSQLNNRFYLFQ